MPTVTARWLAPAAEWLRRGLPCPLVIAAPTARGVVECLYMVSCHREGGRLTGYRLEKEDGTTYDIDVLMQSCECKDHMARRRQCKHLVGLALALAELKEENDAA